MFLAYCITQDLKTAAHTGAPKVAQFNYTLWDHVIMHIPQEDGPSKVDMAEVALTAQTRGQIQNTIEYNKLYFKLTFL